MASYLYTEVCALLAEHFLVEVDSLTPETRLVEDLYADSLELLDLVLDLNAHYQIEIGASDLKQMTTLAQVVAVVKRLTAPVHPL